MIDWLAGLQELANDFMSTDVTIRHRKAGDEDAENPYGDDTTEWEIATTTAKGWLVNPLTRSLDDVGGMSVTVETSTLRLPVGTVIAPHDEVLIAGKTYSVIDVSDDETWPVMLKASLSRET
jgi:hypothetical protein